jgi:hypothetical protein
MWCKSFEELNKKYVQYLLEYKLELLEQTTYVVSKEQFGETKATREVFGNMSFMVLSEHVSDVEDIAKKIEKFRKSANGKEVPSIKIDVNWKVIDKAPIVDPDFTQKMFRTEFN